MFEDLLEPLKRLQSSTKQALKTVNKSKDFLDTLKLLEDNLIRSLGVINENLADIYSKRIYTIVNDRILEDVREASGKILEDNLYQALGPDSEFSNPIYISKLLEVVRNPDILSIDAYLSAGGVYNTIFYHRFREIAGDSSDWANAVIAVRETRKKPPKHNEATLASEKWARYYENSEHSKGVWRRVVGSRLQVSSMPAPFWEILEYGYSKVKLASSYGGFPTPAQPPTNFLGKTIDELESLYKSSMESAKQDVENLKNNLIQYEKLFKEYIDNIEQILREVEDAAGNSVDNIGTDSVPEDNIDNLLDAVRSKYRDTFDYMNKDKLRQVLIELTTVGESGLSFRPTKEGRIEVTASGSPKRARISISTILDIIGG